MTVKTLYDYFRDELVSSYSKQEITSLAKTIFRDSFGVNLSEVLISENQPASKQMVIGIEDAIGKLKKRMPVQYITGLCDFYGLRFKVTPDVLIPRPETEELVDWIIQDVKKGAYGYGRLKILDMGTGSGNIAIALKKNIPNADVVAIDVSGKALTVARGNARFNIAKINFMNYDIALPFTSYLSLLTSFNIIVSNPPYIPLREKKTLLPNVRNFEPHQALFVKDTDPIFYFKKIAEFSLQKLKKGGGLYLEIHEKKGKEIARMLKQKGFPDVQLRNDLNGKERMVRGMVETPNLGVCTYRKSK